MHKGLKCVPKRAPLQSLSVINSSSSIGDDKRAIIANKTLYILPPLEFIKEKCVWDKFSRERERKENKIPRVPFAIYLLLHCQLKKLTHRAIHIFYFIAT